MTPTDTLALWILVGLVWLSLRKPRPVRPPVRRGSPIYDTRAAIDPADVATVWRRNR